MNLLLNELCNVLEDELERQENMLAVCIAQGRAARAHDLEYMEAKTAALNLLIEECSAAEPARLRLIQQAAGTFHLFNENHTLTELIQVAPEPWKSRLQHVQTRMRVTLWATKKRVVDNREVFQRALGVVNEAMESVSQCLLANKPGIYDVHGGGKSDLRVGPAVLDQRG